jgi:hypothetical protein
LSIVLSFDDLQWIVATALRTEQVHLQHAKMSELATKFAEQFAASKIKLPAKNLRTKVRGQIRKAGWTIQFLFGVDDRGEFLDYYATNKFTSDSHARIYADGTIVPLPAISEIVIFPHGASHEDEQRIVAAHADENRRVAKMLKKKGFL